MNTDPAFLSFHGISKTFPGVKALQDISFQCRAGEVHALMGENGAGKSTLLKILSGSYQPSGGEIRIKGTAKSFSNTVDALDAGVAIIYQELHLVPEMSVAENIYLGQLPHKRGLVNRKLLRYEAGLQLKNLGMDIDPDMPLKYLSLGQWQMVEIAKALARNARIIAFDEPTSSLSAREIEHLFRVIRQLREQGRVVLYVSHRMEEIFALSDAITVFKDGRYVRTFTDMANTHHDDLVEAMVGRNLGDIYGYAPRELGPVRLQLDKVEAKAEGIIPVHSVRENINISARRHNLSAGCLIKPGWEAKNADHHIRSLNIKTPGAHQLIMNLSGGNQQKAILGRWLSEEMNVILLDEPTRGIDVGAKHEIYNLIYQLANKGIAVLFASSDLPEVMGLADRIVVMREGEIAGELPHDAATEQLTLSLAMPKTTQAAAVA